jgi:hypothetical protein
MKKEWFKAKGSRLKAIKSNWAKASMGEWDKGVTCPFGPF